MCLAGGSFRSVCHTSPQAVGAAKDMIRGYGGNTPDVIVEALEVEGLAKVSSTPLPWEGEVPIILFLSRP